MRPRSSRAASLFVLVWLLVGCGGGSGGASGDIAATADSRDASQPGDAPSPGDGLAPDTVTCASDDDCEGTLNDLAPCERAVCDTVRGMCIRGQAPDGTSCVTSDPCLVGASCEAGVCAGGRVYGCDDGDPCTTEVCDGAGGCLIELSDVGTACNDGNPCTASDVCDGAGLCRGVDDGTCSCVQDADCDTHDDGDACNGVLICDEGLCTVPQDSVVRCDTSLDRPCERTRCEPATGACVVGSRADGEACDDGDGCTSDDSCEAGACVGVPGPCPCTEDDDCDMTTTDLCAGRHQCVAGRCVVEPGSAVECVDDDPHDCVRPRCDPATGSCAAAALAEGTRCDDGDPCSLFDECTGGACTGGRTRDCDDGNDCTTASCDPASGCVLTALDGVPCDDGDPCTTADECAGGQCTGGGTISCDDANECTADSCVPGAGCSYEAVEGPCDDGDSCTGTAVEPDTCFDGTCSPGASTCPCTEDSDCAPFEDGDLCDGTLVCQDRACVVDPETVVTCPTDDDTECVTNRCQPDTGTCALQAEADGYLCDDGDGCTTADTCRSGVCTPGPEMACDDGPPCTEGECVEGTCEYTPIPNCGGPCTGPDSCVDDDPCTIDDCDLDTGDCRHVSAADGTVCEDGLTCTGGDTCQAGVCVPGELTPCASACIPRAVVHCGSSESAATWDIGATRFMDRYPCLAPTYQGTETAYVFPAQADMRVSVTLTADPGFGLAILRGGEGCDVDTCRLGRPAAGTLAFAADAGQTYLIVVDTGSGITGPFSLDIACSAGETCDNGVDDDGDLLADCDDPECATAAACIETDCANDQDDDDDGLTDCDDLDCAESPACLPETSCHDGIDEDLDGDTDCEDADCVASPFCLPEADCANDQDDDGDGLTDCDDTDCEGTDACIESNCLNAADDDGDGLTDCADDDCIGLPECIEDACGDGFDNDQDGLTDCADGDCEDSPDCTETACDNAADDDRDGLTDCDDADCFERTPCAPLCLPVAELFCGSALIAETAPAGPGLIDGYPGCLSDASLPGGERVYGFVSSRNGPVTVTVRSTGDDMAVLLLDGACRHLAACTDGVDAVGTDGYEVLQFYALANEPYFVVVEDITGGGGFYDIYAVCRGTPELVCDNGVDDDNNGAPDCHDGACETAPACAEADCADGLDNNGNGLTDCEDPACYEQGDCGEWNCSDATDNDADGSVDCLDDDCALDPACVETCGNGIDDDDDGATDCADSDCLLDPACFEDCANGIDDDGDGRTDCLDPSCGPDPLCAEDCANGADDDGDGLEDCLDPDCLSHLACRELVCDDGLDGDDDGLTDCGDPDCFDASGCREVACANGADDDADGWTDCADGDCQFSTDCAEVTCDDGIDDDADGQTDCFDLDCADRPACRDQLCHPVRVLGCGVLADQDLAAYGSTDNFDVYADTCDPWEWDHSGAERAYTFVAPCTGNFALAMTPVGTATGFINAFVMEGTVGCTGTDCIDLSYGDAEGLVLDFEAFEGASRTFLFDGVDGYVGPFDLEVTCDCTPEFETVCDDGLDEDGDASPDCFDSDCAAEPVCRELCEPVVDIACGVGATASVGGPGSTDRIESYPACDPLGFSYPFPETAVRLVAPCDGAMTITTTRTAGEGTLDSFVLRGDSVETCSADYCVAAAFMGVGGVGQTTFAAVAGATYFVVVDSMDASTADFRVEASCDCPGGELVCDDGLDGDGDGRTDCGDPDCDDVPTCASVGSCAPTDVISCGETVSASTDGAVSTVSRYRCNPGLPEMGGEHIYTWEAPATGLVSVLLDIDGRFDLDLFVLRDQGTGCDPAECFVSSAGSDDESLVFLAVEGERYFIVVDGYRGAAGPYFLRLDCTPGCDVTADIACGETVQGDLTTLAAEDVLRGYACDATGADYSGAELTYRLVSPCTGDLTIRVEKPEPGPGALDLIVARPTDVCDGTCDHVATMDVGEGVAELSLSALEGYEYLLTVDGRDGAEGPFSLSVDCGPCLSTDACYGSPTVACNTSVLETAPSGEGRFGFYGCSAWAWPADEWIGILEPSSDVTVRLEVPQGSARGVFALREEGGAGCDPFVCVAGTDLLAPAPVEFEASAGTRYYIVVDGAADDDSPVDLQIDCL